MVITEKLKQPLGLVLSILIILTSLLPLVTKSRVAAAALSSRKATISNSKVSATGVQITFDYTIGNTTNTKAGIIYEFCTTPLGTCTLPTGMNVQASNSHVSQTSWPTNATAFAPVSEAANVGECTAQTNTNMICYSRPEGTATGVTGGAVQHVIGGITAPSSVQTVYIRVHLYTNDDFLTANRLQSGGTDDEGVVAVAFVDQITVTGRVQERLDFCMAAIDDTDSLPASVSACTALSDSGVDIGTIDNTAISRAPVDATATNGADDDYGIAMVNTNASSGVVIAYYADAATNVSSSDTDQLRAFRVLPTNCDPTETNTDQCFTSADNVTAETFVAGTERFGMQVPCVDTTQGTTSNLTVVNLYNNTDNTTTSSADCENTDAGQEYGWNDTSASHTVASSTTVVDDEIVKLRFGATAHSTTPTGSYTVSSVFIATPTF